MEDVREASLLVRTFWLRHQRFMLLICVLLWYPGSSFTQRSISTSIPSSPVPNSSLPMEDFVTDIITEFVNISITEMVAETELVTELTNNSATEFITEKDRKLCCLEGFIEVESSCLLYQDKPTNFLEALDSCSFYNQGSLAKIEPLMTITNYLLQILRFFDDTDLVWIGLTREENGTFEWSFDDDPLNVSNWNTGQPSSLTSLGCVAANRNGTWEVRSCNNTELPYVCQSRHVFCGELTTAPDVTTDMTTAEYTEEVTNATTPKLSTTTQKLTTTATSPQTITATSAAQSTTTKRPKLQTTVDSDDVTTEMRTFDETTRTKPTTIKSTPTLPTTLTMKSTSLSTSSATNVLSATSPITLSANATSGQVSTNPPSTPSSQTVSNRVRSTGDVNNPTGDGIASTTTKLTTPVPPRPGLAPINKFLISIIVIFTVLAIIIGCIVIYLFYKRKQSKQAAYNVEEAELDGINSVEDLAGPSTSASETSGGIASTSFINDELPGFSGSHFSGLRGKRYSYDIT